MMKKHVPQSDSEEGQILVLFALFSLVLVGMLALAIDVGYLMSERRLVQNAVDAAATAGGVALLNGEGESIVRATANSYAEENGVDATGVNVGVEGDARDGRVTVEAEVEVQRFFLGAVYTGDWSVSARAVAEVDDERNGQYALIALEEPGMDLSGRPAVIIKNGSAMSNGDVTQNGGKNRFVTDGTIDAVGVVEPNENWVAPDGFNGGRPVYDDPLGSVTKPSFAGLVVYTTDNLPDCGTNDGCTLLPGYYKNVNITVKRTVMLQPGFYYFENSKLALQNTNSRIEGRDVMLYFTGSSAQFIPKNGEVHLEAPATSHYPGGHDGMAVWIENCSSMEWGGNTEFFVSGIFYAPCSQVWLHGTPDGDVLDGQMIVGSINLDGNGTLSMAYRNYVNTPRFELYLVE